MPGFDDSPFGDGPFGYFDWAKYQLLDLVPDIYKSQDDFYGGVFQAFLRSLTGPVEYLFGKIETLDDLRDPLMVPAESAFERDMMILQVDNLGDGTSRVFVSKGEDGLGLEGVRVGHVLRDSLGNEFEITQINASDLPSQYDTLPIDPFTDDVTARNVIVLNAAAGLQDVVPQVSGYQITEDPTPTPVDNGTNRGPYAFTVGHPPLAANTITVSWTEAGEQKLGYIAKDGNYSGQLDVGTSVDFTTGAMQVAPSNGIAIDPNSLRIAYTTKLIYRENPTPTPVDNGTNAGPYSVTAGFPPLAASAVTVEWTEFGVSKVGSFSNLGTPSGDLSGGSTINFATGVMSVNGTSGAKFDPDSLRITYLSSIVLPPIDATIHAQNLISFLASDYGVLVDRNDPESFQRSQLYNAYQLWDIKGTQLGYEIMGMLSGFDVSVSSLNKVSSGLAATVDSQHLYIFKGDRVIQENPGYLDPTGFVFPPEDGTTLSFSIHTELGRIYQDSDIVMSWTEAEAVRSASLTSMNIISGDDASSIVSWTADRLAGSMSVAFATGHAPDVDSIRLTYDRPAFYTDLPPRTLVMDDVAMDAIPLDTYCFNTDYPIVTQTVSVTSVTVLSAEALGSIYSVTATTSAASQSFGTDGTLVDASANSFGISNYTRVDNTTSTFEVFSAVKPATGSATIQWRVLKDTGDFITDNPDTTAGSTISPDEDGTTLGPFTIQLARHPLWTSPSLTITWNESTVAKTATLSGTTTLSGTNAANISSASINRTTGVLTITFAGGHAPAADSVRVTYSPQSDLTIIGIGTDVVQIGRQYVGYTGIRYRLTSTFPGPIALASVGSWKIIDANGVQSWIESCNLTSTSPYTYEFEFISESVPAAGPANIFYICELFPTCQFCAASAIHINLTPDTILGYPDVNVAEASDRLINRMSQVIPAHVRIADFSVDGEGSGGKAYVFGGKSHGLPNAPGETFKAIERWDYASSTATMLTTTLTDSAFGGTAFGNLQQGVVVGGLFAGFQYINVFNYANETALAGATMGVVSADYVETACSNSTIGFVMCEPGSAPQAQKYDYASATWTASGNNAFWVSDGLYGWTRAVGNETVSVFAGGNGTYKYAYAADAFKVVNYSLDHLLSWIQARAHGAASDASTGIYLAQGQYHEANLAYEFATEATYPLRASLGFASGQPRPSHRSHGAGNADVAAFFGGDKMVDSVTDLFKNVDDDNFSNTITQYSYADKTLTDVGFLATKLGYMTALATQPGGLLPPKHLPMSASDQGVCFIAEQTSIFATTTFNLRVPGVQVGNALRNGDFMLATVTFNTNGGGAASGVTFTIPGGWTLIRRTNLGDQGMITMYRFASNEPSSYAVSHSIPSGSKFDAVVRTYSNVSASAPITDVQVASASSVLSLSTPSVQVSNPMDRVIIAMLHNDSTYPLGYTFPHNLFPRAYAGAAGSYYALYFEDLIFNAGPSTQQQFTFVAPSVDVMVHVISLKRGPV